MPISSGSISLRCTSAFTQATPRSTVSMLRSVVPALQKGVRTPDEAVPFRAYVDELGKRGIRIEEL